jgi:hypothetical protein
LVWCRPSGGELGRSLTIRRANAATRETKRAWLTPGVLGIGLASFLADAGHEVPTAILPSFLAATLGALAAALGLIEGLADGAAGGARLLGGALADDPQRRRRVAAGGYIGTAVLAALIGLTGAVSQAALLRTAAWTTRGLRVPPPERSAGRPHRAGDVWARLRLRTRDG